MVSFMTPLVCGTTCLWKVVKVVSYMTRPGLLKNATTPASFSIKSMNTVLSWFQAIPCFQFIFSSLTVSPIFEGSVGTFFCEKVSKNMKMFSRNKISSIFHVFYLVWFLGETAEIFEEIGNSRRQKWKLETEDSMNPALDFRGYMRAKNILKMLSLIVTKI